MAVTPPAGNQCLKFLNLLFGDLIFQIGKEFFAGLNGLIHLLGVFIAHKYADDKTQND
jgi:hypothetical protein